ncbi:hypothetical protein JVU11DRAFT_8944 [Chiua virens]|nr:hypothetical protein JVU11DRAFT_8944 [Chiua virens]
MALNWVNLRWTVSHRYLIVFILACLLIFPTVPRVLRSVLRSNCCKPHWTLKPFVLGDMVDSHSKSELAHGLSPEGLLIVDPDAPHPIFQLIRDAEAAWDAKCARASKTLDEAVAEYKRRYRRAPPLGFDKWWEYVVRHQVQLPDEYDEIFEDIEPFWGIDPTELARTQIELETSAGVVTVGKTDDVPRFKVVNTTLTKERQYLEQAIHSILDLIRDVELYIPPMRITISPFDNPDMLMDWEIRSMALEAAANRRTLTRVDMPPVKQGWIQACPPDSPARLHPPDFSSRSTAARNPPSSPKTFIASHRNAMDPCLHPSLFTSHGQFLALKEGPFPRPTLVPRFSLSATVLHSDIRPPVPYGWDWTSDGEADGAFKEDVPWEHKVDERLGWRGRTTGIYASADTVWMHGHRERLITLTTALEGNVSVLLAPEGGEEAMPVGEPESVRLARINPAWMDMAFAEGPIGCDKTGGTCREMEKLWEYRSKQGRREEGRYKFIFDIDGNGWSSRFKRLITTNALIFKATVYPEWCAGVSGHVVNMLTVSLTLHDRFTSRIAPWVHYVPIQISYADLYDAVAFFRAQDELAARIAKAGREWSLQFWRKEDMTAYMYRYVMWSIAMLLLTRKSRLLLEYARVTSFDRASMDYTG